MQFFWILEGFSPYMTHLIPLILSIFFQIW